MIGPYMTPDDCLKGGEAAGQFLDSVNAPFPALTEDQWRTFCVLLVNGANRAAGERIVGAWLVPFE